MNEISLDVYLGVLGDSFRDLRPARVAHRPAARLVARQRGLISHAHHAKRRVAGAAILAAAARLDHGARPKVLGTVK